MNEMEASALALGIKIGWEGLHLVVEKHRDNDGDYYLIVKQPKTKGR